MCGIFGYSGRSPDAALLTEAADGYHRWMVSGRPDVGSLTGGLVPIVRITGNPADLMGSTIRHNRARGSHQLLRMAEIVRSMVDENGVPPEAIQELLGMEDEEVERLYDRGDMGKRAGKEAFGAGWEPKREPGR